MSCSKITNKYIMFPNNYSTCSLFFVTSLKFNDTYFFLII